MTESARPFSPWLRSLTLVALGLGPILAGRASGAPAGEGDVLVFRNGDRVSGRVVSAGPEIVFQSERFGELRVPAADATVQRAGATAAIPPTASRPAAVAPTPAAARPAAAPTDLDSPSLGELQARIRDFFGPWQGRIAVAVESVQEAVDRENLSLDSTLRRRWEKDELQFTGRFDYVQSNAVPSTDVIRGSASWRHEFSKQYFTQYRPSVEWNRANRRGALKNRYVLLQQEVGVGYNVVTTAERKLRTGVSFNSFELWNSTFQPDHTQRNVQSLFEEIELKLPWQLSVTQRGVWYPVGNGPDGWDNRIEISKKLTQTLSTAVRHELRRDNPDGSAQDYTRLRMMLGLDF
jgi:hypothetical protein